MVTPCSGSTEDSQTGVTRSSTLVPVLTTRLGNKSPDMSHLPISITDVKNRTSLNAQWGRDTHNELSKPGPLGHSPWPQVLWGGLKIGSYGGWIPPGIELTFASLPCGETLAMHLLNHLVQYNWEKQPQNIPGCLL